MTLDRAASGRRSFLKSSSTIAAAPLLGPLAALQARHARAAGPSALVPSPYGPLAPVRDQTTGLELLLLPRGFGYKSYGWTADPLRGGAPTPGNHDGMAVVRSRRVGRATELTLIRNHELGGGALIPARGVYDGATITIPPGVKDFPVGTVYPNGAAGMTSGFTGTLAGGTSNLVFRNGDWVEAVPSLGGTAVNCAGGPTPWGTWLSCEETVVNYERWGGRKHGYIFEVRPDADATTAVPIVAAGRLVHEACAIDPLTGILYQTEDNRNAAGFYRYIPDVVPGGPGTLERGGRLQAARAIGVANADLVVAAVGDSYRLEWVDIPEPDAEPVLRANFPDFGPSNQGPAPGTAALTGPYAQAWDSGCLRMSRGEGIWYWNRKMYIVDTSTGLENRTTPPPRRGRGDGAVWELDLDAQTLTCIYAVPQFASQIGNNPDNITVSPRGGLLFCEDGGTFSFDGRTVGARLMGLGLDGDTWAFAENNQTPAVMAAARAQGKWVPGTPTPTNQTGAEFAGACFDPTGRVLFVNFYRPGCTVAISGPWANGPL
jgi:secreted PhoX family phosphatase